MSACPLHLAAMSCDERGRPEVDPHGLLQTGVHERIEAFRCVGRRGVPVTGADLELHEVDEHLPQQRQLSVLGDLPMVVLEVHSGTAQIAGPHR